VNLVKPFELILVQILTGIMLSGRATTPNKCNIATMVRQNIERASS